MLVAVVNPFMIVGIETVESGCNGRKASETTDKMATRRIVTSIRIGLSFAPIKAGTDDWFGGNN